MYERSTKNTHVYSTREPNAAISTLYIAKIVAPKAPDRIVITVQEAKEV